MNSSTPSNKNLREREREKGKLLSTIHEFLSVGSRWVKS